jgi:putative ABC transport system permease protein
LSSQERLTSLPARVETALAEQRPRVAARCRRSSPASLLARPLFRPFELAGFVLKRQFHHPGLTLLALLGIVLAVGLVTNASCFSEGAAQLILNQRMAEFRRMTKRPAFSTAIYAFPSARQPISLEAAEQAANHVAGTLASEVGLPLKHLGVQVRSCGMMLQPKEGSSLYGEGQSYLGSIDLAYIAEVGDHMEIVAGESFDDDVPDGTSGEALGVWMHTRLAERMGVHPGEEFQIGATLVSAAVPIRVRGIWQAGDPADVFWFTDPDSALKDTLIVRRQDYITFIEPMIPSKTGGVYWHILLDESKVTPASVGSYIEGFERGLAIVNKYLPDVRLDSPPLDPLKEFVGRETTITALLLSFNVPAFGFLLYFLVLTSAIIARWQRRDTAVLVSRGMSISSILGLTLIEELLLFVVGFPLGIGFGLVLTLLMGYASSFLSFTPRPPMPVSLRGINVPLTLVALGVTLIARLWSAVQAARRGVVQLEREQARPMRAPFWYRYYLDLLLLLPAAYAYHQLANQGTLAMLIQDRPEDLYRDPLLILVPGLFILAAALLALRVFPLVVRGIDSLADAVPWITPHLTLRQLSRQSLGYINPLLLLIVSLALGVYMLSLAASLDQWLVDRMYYRVGTDLAFEPYPFSAAGSEVEGPGPIGGIWIPLPYEFLDLPGVVAVTRVGDYPAKINLAVDDEIGARFLAVDRLDFPSVAWFREDFAQEALGALMNQLALSPDAILVPQQFLNQHPVKIGDKIPLKVTVDFGLRVNTLFTVVGAYEYFPTVHEEEVTVIGNLEHLSNAIGVPAKHHIWLRVQEGTDGQAVFKAVSRMGVVAGRQRDAPALIAEEQAKVERVGVFGTLSVGFLAAVAMAGIGLSLHNYASLRESLFRFAVLRALGLSRRQVVIQVVMEYALLTACGTTAGAFIGAAASELFAPFFTVTGEEGLPLPPLIPIIARQDVVYLAAVFVIVMVLLGVVAIARAFSRRHFDLLKAHWG